MLQEQEHLVCALRAAMPEADCLTKVLEYCWTDCLVFAAQDQTA